MSKDKEKKELTVDEFIPMYIERVAQSQFDDFLKDYNRKIPVDELVSKEEMIKIEIDHINSILTDEDYLPICVTEFRKDGKQPRTFFRRSLAMLENAFFVEQGKSKIIGNNIVYPPKKNKIALFYKRFIIKRKPVENSIKSEYLREGYGGIVVELVPHGLLKYKEKLENLASKEKGISFLKELFGDDVTILPNSSKKAAPIVYDLAVEKANVKFEDWLNNNRLWLKRASFEDLEERFKKIEKSHRANKHPLFNLETRSKDVVINAIKHLLHDAKQGYGVNQHTPSKFIIKISNQLLNMKLLEHLDNLLDERENAVKDSKKKAKEPDPPPSFDELTPMITDVLETLNLLTEIGTFKGKAGNIKVLFDALTSKGYIHGLDTKVQVAFADYFKNLFKGSVTDRTLRNLLTEKQEEMLLAYKAAIPKREKK